MRRARLSAKAAAEKRGLSAEAAAAAGVAASTASTWTAKDDVAVLTRLDALRSKRFAVSLVEKAKAKAGVGTGTASEDDDDDEEEVGSVVRCFDSVYIGVSFHDKFSFDVLLLGFGLIS